MNRIKLEGVIVSNTQMIGIATHKYNLVTLFNKCGHFIVAMQPTDDVYFGSKLYVEGELQSVQVRAKVLSDYWGYDHDKDDIVYNTSIILADKVKAVSKITKQSEIEITGQHNSSGAQNGLLCIKDSISSLTLPCNIEATQSIANAPIKVNGILNGTSIDKKGYMQYSIDVKSIDLVNENNREVENG